MTIQELEQLIATYGTDIYMAIRIWKSRNRKMFHRNRIAPMKSTEETHVETAVPGTADTSEVEEGVLRREEIRQVQEILRRLPDKYRILLCMYYGEKLSVEEIAGCLRIPQGTVNSSPSAEVQRNLHRRIAEKAQAEIPAKRRFSRKMQFAVCGLAVLLITGCAAVEQFSNGFTFQRAAMMNTEALDDAGEKLFGDKCLELIYGDGTHTIAIGLETSELAEKIVHKSFAKQHRVRQIRDRLRCRTAVYEVHPPYCVGDGRYCLLHLLSVHGQIW